MCIEYNYHIRIKLYLNQKPLFVSINFVLGQNGKLASKYNFANVLKVLCYLKSKARSRTPLRSKNMQMKTKIKN